MQTSPTTLIPAGQPLNLAAMPRADLAVIFDGFKTKFDALVATATTLTVTNAGQTAEMKLAHTTRMQLREIRLDLEKKRKELTDHHLKTKQHIDQCAKWLKDQIEPLEARLEDQEKFATRQEEKRRAQLRYDRALQLTPLGVDTTLYALADMDETAFKSLLEASKFADEDRQRQLEASALEQERVYLENEQLRKQAADQQAALDAERQKREAAEKTVRDQQEAEANAEAERQLIAAKAAQAPDREKLLAFATALESHGLPVAATPAGACIFDSVRNAQMKLADWVRQQASTI